MTEQRETIITSLAYSRRLGTGIDATAMLNWWSHGGTQMAQPDLWSVAAGLRVRIERAPRLRSRTQTVAAEASVRTGRLIGMVRDDSGAGIAGVTLQLTGRGTRETVTSDSSGRFRVDAAEGDYELTVLADSVPIGYDPSELASPSIHLEPGAPISSELLVRAERSVGGTIHSQFGVTSIRLVELDRAGTVDDAGRYGARNHSRQVQGARLGSRSARLSDLGRVSRRQRTALRLPERLDHVRRDDQGGDRDVYEVR